MVIRNAASAMGAMLVLAGGADAQPTFAAKTVRIYPAPEANQGVAVDDRFFYAVDNSTIGRYDKTTGQKTGAWTGDPKVFPHLNSCAAIGAELVCASSNYPATPMVSTVEIFDRAKLIHTRSIPLGRQFGSLTWAVRQGDAWWACFANYDGRGGEPGRDHTATTLVRFDDAWKAQGQWLFPAGVLSQFTPMSSSGGVLGDDGLFYITGHDAAALFVMRAAGSGGTLEHVATITAPIEGQAVARDPTSPRTLYGINRKARQVVAFEVPAVATGK